LDNPRGLKRLIKKVMLGRVLRASTGSLVCGRLGRDYFARYGQPEDRIFYVPLEPDYQLIQVITADKVARMQSRLGLQPGRRRFVYSGRLVEVKRVDLLIDAFAQIASLRDEWDLLIIGNGVLRQALQARVPPGLASRVQWTGFLDDQAAVSALYRLSDVLVLPSDFEPWALVILEAVAAGLAIVASNIVGAAVELVRDGENGRIFHRGDLKDLVQCLEDVTDPSRIESLKTASLKILEQWRRDSDPIAGLRQALGSCGITCG
jgi:glycosyltransferase involved in cell wall biosynthesis